jgi:hypothetical protein
VLVPQFENHNIKVCCVARVFSTCARTVYEVQRLQISIKISKGEGSKTLINPLYALKKKAAILFHEKQNSRNKVLLGRILPGTPRSTALLWSYCSERLTNCGACTLFENKVPIKYTER